MMGLLVAAVALIGFPLTVSATDVACDDDGCKSLSSSLVQLGRQADQVELDMEGSETLDEADEANMTEVVEGPYRCPSPYHSTDCVRSAWHHWKADKQLFQSKCNGKLVRWGQDSGVQDCGVLCFACSYIRACCDDCKHIKKVEGFWQSIGYTDEDLERVYQVGVKVEKSSSWQRTNSWSHSVTASATKEASVSVPVKGAEASAGGSLGLSGTASWSFVESFSSSWKSTQSSSKSIKWTQPAGTNGWKWMVRITTSCGEKISETNDRQSTPRGESPCCLPGMNATPDLYGDCIFNRAGEKINLCTGTVTKVGVCGMGYELQGYAGSTTSTDDYRYCANYEGPHSTMLTVSAGAAGIKECREHCQNDDLCTHFGKYGTACGDDCNDWENRCYVIRDCGEQVDYVDKKGYGAVYCKKVEAAYDYKLIGSGYCSDWKYLPEGEYPPFLDASNPLYSADRIEECMKRCIAAHKSDSAYGMAAFYVTADKKCGCSKGSCSSRKGSGYSSYAIFA